jgi:sugar phosphate permease
MRRAGWVCDAPGDQDSVAFRLGERDGFSGEVSILRTRFRWVTIGLIVGLCVINYVDRGAISYAVTPLSERFGITSAQYGIISGAFAVGYLVFAVLSGMLVDRFGPRRILLAGMLIWSLASALTPVAGGFAGLLLLRILLGVGEAPGFPAATRVASRWLPAGERGIGLALIGGVAVSGSLLISGPIVTQLISLTSWQGMFWILSAVGVAWAAVAYALLRNTPAEHPRCSPEERKYIERGQLALETTHRETRIDWRTLLVNRNLWAISFGYFAWGFMFWGFLYWLPRFLSQTYHLSLTQVGAFSVAPWAAGLVGGLLGGILADRLYARTGRIRTRFALMAVALLLSGASLTPILVAPSLLTALLSISLGVGFGFVTGGLWWVTAIDAAPSQPGSAAGFADAAFALSGIVAPVSMGFIVQETGTFTSGFVTMSVLAVLGALVLFLATTDRKAPAPTPQHGGHTADRPR